MCKTCGQKIQINSQKVTLQTSPPLPYNASVAAVPIKGALALTCVADELVTCPKQRRTLLGMSQKKLEIFYILH
jgi:hypothetical protein